MDKDKKGQLSGERRSSGMSRGSIASSGSVLQDFGIASLHIATSPVRPSVRERMMSRMLNSVVMWRCTDRLLTAILLAIGSLASFLLLLSVGSNEWLYTREPLYVNKTDAKKVPWEVTFAFTSGYWKACRERFKENETALDDEHRDFYSVSAETKLICMPNVFFSGNDELGQISKATVAILNRIQISAVFHILSFIFCLAATILGSMGHFQCNVKTLYASIAFICSGMLICIAELQYISVVDDEMTPRMKPTPQGDPSKFTYSYGYAFFVASSCFILLQMCAVGFLSLFMRRFSGLEDKMTIVPGLKDKIRSAYKDRDSEEQETTLGYDDNALPNSNQFQSSGSAKRRGSYGLMYNVNSPSATREYSGNVVSGSYMKDVFKQSHEDRCPLNKKPLVFFDEEEEDLMLKENNNLIDADVAL